MKEQNQLNINKWWQKNRSTKSIFYDNKPYLKIPMMHERLIFLESRWLTWIRTNSMPLNDHLYRMKIRTDNLCACSDGSTNSIETVHQFIFQCPRFGVLRNKLIQPHGPPPTPPIILKWSLSSSNPMLVEKTSLISYERQNASRKASNSLFSPSHWNSADLHLHYKEQCLMESRAAPPSQKFTDKLSARTLSVPIPRVSYWT